MPIPLTTERSIATLARYLKAANPGDVAPLMAAQGNLAKMFDVDSKTMGRFLRENHIPAYGVDDSGPRYCVLEVWDAVQETRGKEFPKRGGNRRSDDGTGYATC